MAPFKAACVFLHTRIKLKVYFPRLANQTIESRQQLQAEKRIQYRDEKIIKKYQNYQPTTRDPNLKTQCHN